MKPNSFMVSTKLDYGPFIPERIEEWAYWIRERENIRIKRAKGEAAPWTMDRVMATTRWCNVRRMDDKVSIWLMENWYPAVIESQRAGDAVIAGLTARMINRTATLSVMTGGKPFRKWDRDRFYDAMYGIKNGGGQVFTNAYIINGASGGPKIDQVINAINIAAEKIKTNGPSVFVKRTMEETAESMHVLPGVGSFIAGQVIADLRWVLHTREWPDRMTWAPVGPGSSRGMKYLLGLIGPEGVLGRGKDMSQKEFLKNLRFLIDLAQRHPVVKKVFAERRLEAHDIQNTLCETGKFIRVGYGLGRPKNFYEAMEV